MTVAAPYTVRTIVVRLPDADAKRQALGKLPGRFTFKSWATGEMMVPEGAMAFLAVEGIPDTVEGPASDERNVQMGRGAPAASV